MASTAVLRIVAPEDGADGSWGYFVHFSVNGGPEISAPLGFLENIEEFGTVFDRGAGDEDREEAGDRLFAALLGGLTPEWTRLRDTAERRDPLRVLLTIEPTELRSLPWELMRHQGHWLWRRRELLFRRGVAYSAQANYELGPLRVLVVIATSPRDDGLLAEEELAAISGALETSPGRAHLEVLDCPGSAAELADSIDRLRPHVLHFIGHGMPRPGGGSPELAFTPDQGDGWELLAGEIADLADWQPMLVVLNACRTAHADPDDWIGGMAHAFLDAGTRAVVSMQDDITSDAAVVFSTRFYKELGSQRPIDVCLAEARSELAKLSVRTGSWALPVLLTRSDPAAVLPIVFRPPPIAALDDIRRCKQYVDLHLFVGRSDERRQAWWALDDPSGPPAALDSSSVLVVSGRSQNGFDKTGKTWLTNWCLLTWFLRGHHIVSVNLAKRSSPPGLRPGEGYGSRTKDWLTVIRMIREQAVSADQLCPLPKDTFGEFNAVLNHLVAGGAAEGGAHPAEDEWKEFNDEARRADERKERIMEAFLLALRKAAGTQPLVIALDHAENIMQESFTSELYEGLVRPVAYGTSAPLRLILVATDPWVGSVLPDADSHMISRVQLGDFKRSQFMRLARAYSSRLGCIPDEDTIRMLQGFHALPDEYFSVDLFDTITPHVPQWRTAIAQGVPR